MATSPVGFGHLEARLHAASDPKVHRNKLLYSWKLLSLAFCVYRFQSIKKILRGEEHVEIDVNAKDFDGDAYLHVLVRRIVSSSGHKMKPKHKKTALECLWTFLVYCDSTHFDVNIVSNKDGSTALHIGVLVSPTMNLLCQCTCTILS